MAIGIDNSRWKPRRLRGTPASKVTNILGIGILGFGIICGAFFQFNSYTKNLRKATEVLYVDPLEEIERRQLIAGGLPLMSGDAMRRVIEEDSMPNQPDK